MNVENKSSEDADRDEASDTVYGHVAAESKPGTSELRAKVSSNSPEFDQAAHRPLRVT
jgi:hypothetical protein